MSAHEHGLASAANSIHEPTIPGPIEKQWSEYAWAIREQLLAPCGDMERTSANAKPPTTGDSTTIEVSLGTDGKLTNAERVASSGDGAHDAAVEKAILAAQPYPLAAETLASWDGRVHLLVSLGRDESRCGRWHVDPLMLSQRRPLATPQQAQISPLARPRPDIPAEYVGTDPSAWARFRDVQRSYVTAAVPGHAVRLLGAADTFAEYLSQFHTPLHKAFARSVLATLPSEGPLADPSLAATAEIVVRPDGSLDRVAIVQHSAQIAYDFAVFQAILGGGPYPVPPQSIRSPDGMTYFHWTLHRDDSKCGTWNAMPYLLKPDHASQRAP